MYKLMLLVILLSFSAIKLAAQVAPKELTKEELILAIQKSKPDTNRVSLQLKLGNYYMYHPHKVKNSMDSAINVFNQAIQLSTKLHEIDWEYTTLGRIAIYYEYSGDQERCKQTYMRIIHYYHQKGNSSKEAEAWTFLAAFYHNDIKYSQETISYYQNARSLYLQIHQPLNAALILIDIADVQITNKQFDVAEKELQQVLAQFKTSGYNLRYIYKKLDDLEYDKGNYYRAMSYCLQSIETLKESGDTTRYASFYAEIAKCNYAVKKYEESLEWIRKSIAIRPSFVDDRCILAQNLIALNRTKEARAALNDISSGKFELALWDTLNIYRTSALYYTKLNKNDLAA